ncbi:transcript variant X3 [Nothobranchius furzeri]|uniref:Transcript variant X3 n=1 Tax=Nothobranchius furzeri TaxID=105023 RepID=A0A9D3BUF0_NOTFU|nr:transcript variant X3 [Nothobranchius furzeri]
MSTGQQRQPSRFRMSKDTLRSNKTDIVMGLCGDYRLVLNKVLEKKLITQREYNNLKSIPNENIEGHVVELVDKIMNKGEDTCKAFLDLLQTDDEIKTTLPELANIQDNCLLPTPAQESSLYGDAPEAKRLKQEELYELRSQPVGLCMIINNEKFSDGTSRGGTNTDAPKKPAAAKKPRKLAEAKKPRKLAAAKKPKKPAEAKKPKKPAAAKKPKKPAEAKKPRKLAAPRKPKKPKKPAAAKKPKKAAAVKKSTAAKKFPKVVVKKSPSAKKAPAKKAAPKMK